MKGLLIFSTLLNIVLMGSLGAYYYVFPTDAEWFLSTYSQMSESDREVTRKATTLFAEADGDAAKVLKDIYVDDVLKEQFKELGAASDVQQLLVQATRATNRNLDARARETDTAIERYKIRTLEYTDKMKALADGQAKLVEERKGFDDIKRLFVETSKNTALNRLIERINKAKKVDAFLSSLSGRPPRDQLYVLSQLKGDKYATLVNKLPPEELEAIKALEANPLGTPSAITSSGTAPASGQ